MPKVEIANARIEQADLVIHDHGFLTDHVGFAFGSYHQGLGGYRLDKCAGAFVLGLLRVTGKTELSKIKGSIVRVESTDGLITAVGHAIDDIWFRPKDLFDA